jgi:hypothetical protein
MPPYEKQLIEETAKLTKENNKILRGMARAAWWARFFSILRWFIIIALTLGAYYYLEPYLKTLLNLYSSLGSNIPNINELQEALKNLKSI